MEVGAYEAKTSRSRRLDEVGEGKRCTITEPGKAVAVLLRLGSGDSQAAAVQELRRFPKGITRGVAGRRELIEKGRR